MLFNRSRIQYYYECACQYGIYILITETTYLLTYLLIWTLYLVVAFMASSQYKTSVVAPTELHCSFG